MVELKDFESYIKRRIDPSAPRLVVSDISPTVFIQSRQSYVDPFLASLFTFISTVYDVLSIDYFLLSIDLVDYSLMIFPFATDEFESCISGILNTMVQDDMNNESRLSLIMNINRIIGRIFIIKKQHQLSSDHPLWSIILSILNADHSEGTYQEVYCYALILVYVGESMLDDTDSSLVHLFKRMSIDPSPTTNPSLPEAPNTDATSMIKKILEMLVTTAKMMNSTMSDVKDLIRENIDRMIDESEEIERSVGWYYLGL